MSKKKTTSDKKELVSWNDLKNGEMFTGPGGLYMRNSEDEAFYFNAHTEIPVTNNKNKDNKVFTRTTKKG